MIAWEHYRDLAAPAGVLTADPNWLTAQYAAPPTPPPTSLIFDFPRGLSGASVIPARNVRLCVLALNNTGVVLAPGTGTLTVQLLEVIPGPTGPVLVEVVASLALGLNEDEDSTLGALGTGDYILRAISSANVPVGTTGYRILKKAIG